MIYCIDILWYLLNAYNFILIAGVIMTWLPFLYNFKIFRMIAKMCDWYLGPFRGILVLGPLDFTPLIGFFLYDGIVSLIYFL